MHRTSSTAPSTTPLPEVRGCRTHPERYGRKLGWRQEFCDRLARNRILFRPAEREAYPVVQRRLGATDGNALAGERSGDRLLRLPGVEEDEVANRVRVTETVLPEQRVPGLTLRCHLVANGVDVAGIVQARRGGNETQPVEPEEGADTGALQRCSELPWRQRVADRKSCEAVDL